MELENEYCDYQSDEYAEYPEEDFSHSQPVKYIDYTQPEAEQGMERSIEYT